MKVQGSWRLAALLIAGLGRLVAQETIASVRVFLLYGIDPLAAVPLDAFRTTTALHKKRWPQIERDVRKKRATLGKLARPRR